jgi:hypothetical protein
MLNEKKEYRELAFWSIIIFSVIGSGSGDLKVTEENRRDYLTCQFLNFFHY